MTLADKIKQAQKLQQKPPQPTKTNDQIDSVIASDPRWQELIAKSKTARPRD